MAPGGNTAQCYRDLCSFSLVKGRSLQAVLSKSRASEVAWVGFSASASQLCPFPFLSSSLWASSPPKTGFIPEFPTSGFLSRSPGSTNPRPIRANPEIVVPPSLAVAMTTWLLQLVPWGKAVGASPATVRGYPLLILTDGWTPMSRWVLIPYAQPKTSQFLNTH